MRKGKWTEEEKWWRRKLAELVLLPVEFLPRPTLASDDAATWGFEDKAVVQVYKSAEFIWEDVFKVAIHYNVFADSDYVETFRFKGKAVQRSGYYIHESVYVSRLMVTEMVAARIETLKGGMAADLLVAGLDIMGKRKEIRKCIPTMV